MNKGVISKTRSLSCNECNNKQEIKMEYKKEFWKCNKCGFINVCTHYVDSMFGFSKKDSNILSGLGKRRFQPR